MFTLTHRPSLTHATASANDAVAWTLSALVDDDGIIHAAGFTTPEVLAARLGIDVPQEWEGAEGDMPSKTAASIARYFDGDLEALADLRLQQPGTEFQHLVWDALVDVPAGQTATYSDLATAIGRPKAVRAVGSACGRNLIAPFVPCHRAVRTDGSLGGYLYGLEVKDWLLGHESGHD